MKIIRTTDEIIAVGKDIKVVLGCIGEGYNGDYNPDDTEDRELLRFDIFVKNEETKEFDEITESRCTCMSTSLSDERMVKAVSYIYKEIKEAFDAGASLKRVADTLSWLDDEEITNTMAPEIADTLSWLDDEEMTNTMTPEIEKFINKAQIIMHELYEEFNSLDATSLIYGCPLTEYITDMQYFCCKNAVELIDERAAFNLNRN